MRFVPAAQSLLLLAKWALHAPLCRRAGHADIITLLGQAGAQRSHRELDIPERTHSWSSKAVSPAAGRITFRPATRNSN